MDLEFNKVWASDTSPEYPTDTQAKRGLSFLGTEAPTFDLHDAIFKRLDLKDQWLYDQIRIACERFGQDVDNSIAGAARDTMANAITNALLTQRKADEGGYGIVRMANADQTNAGNEYNLAVSPKHLAEYVSAQNTWENTKDKPQTATRWPDYSEVKNTPSLGSAAYMSASEFDPAGAASDVYKSSVQRDFSFRAGFVGGDKLNPYIEYLNGSQQELVPLARSAWVGDIQKRLGRVEKGLGSASAKNAEDFDAAGAAGKVYDSSVQRDSSYRAGFVGGDIFNPYIEHSQNGVNTIVPLARSAWVSEIQNSLGTASKRNENYFERAGSATAVKSYVDSYYAKRDYITRIGLYAGSSTFPFMLSENNEVIRIPTYSQAVPITSGNRKSGKRVWSDGYVEQWGELGYGDVSVVTKFTVTFPNTFTEVLSCIAVVDSAQDVYLTRIGLEAGACSFRLKEQDSNNVGGNIAWKATGWIK